MKKIHAVIIALMLGFSAALLPIAPLQKAVIGIFIASLYLWITQSIGWPSLLAIFLLALIPDLGASFVLSSAFGNSTFLFLFFTFILTGALAETSLIERIALFFIRSRFSQKSEHHLLVSVIFSAFLLGLFLSPTVLFMIYYPIILEIGHLLGIRLRKNPLANKLMMGSVFAIAIASGMTPVAHVFPAMAIGYLKEYAGISLGALSYSLMALPIGVSTLLLMFLFLRIGFSSDNRRGEKKRHLPMKAHPVLTFKEKALLGIYLGVILLWFLQDFVKPLKVLGLALPPLLGCILAMILTDDNGPLLLLPRVMSKHVSFPALFMTASTLAFAACFTHESVALPDMIAQKMASSLVSLSPLFFLFVITSWAGIQTNLSSNMVTVTVVSACAMPLSLAVQGLDPVYVAIAIGLMASFSFAAPAAHPNVALAGASDMTTPGQLFFYGFLLMAMSVLVCTGFFFLFFL